MREYHIDLSQEYISWRRFMALMSGLTGDCAFYTVIRHDRDNKPIENTDTILQDMLGKLSKK